MDRAFINKSDACVFAVLCALSAGLFFSPAKSIRTPVAAISKDGVFLYTVSLDIDGEFVITGTNVHITVKNGQIGVISSDCADKTCVKSGFIGKRGGIIICAPNRVSVEIINAETPDAVAY